jgi:hypothetical protein
MATVKKLKGPPVRTEKVLLLKGVILGPGQKGKAGEIYEVPKYLATQLVSSGQAELTDDGDPLAHDETPAEDKGKFGVATVEAPTSRDPKPLRRG